MRRWHVGALLQLLTLIGTLPSSAVDGVIEINAAKAAVGGVTPGDAPGFPVTISVPGSYLLTSNLGVLGDQDTTGIEITTADVTLDLGGFTVSSCNPGCGAGEGIGIASTGIRTTIRNGRVRGMGSYGVWLQASGRVEDLDVANNYGSGIAAIEGSFRRVSAKGNFGNGITILGGLLEDSELSGNSLNGAALGPYVGFARNVFVANTTSVIGGHAIGGNVCSDKLCSVSGARRFYLTKTNFLGNQPLAACASGFHMASLWEIREPSALFYHRDPAVAVIQADSGQGPPADDRGWVRTGEQSSNNTVAGEANCATWTSTTGMGSTVQLSEFWRDPGFMLSPWDATPDDCFNHNPVWCVED